MCCFFFTLRSCGCACFAGRVSFFDPVEHGGCGLSAVFSVCLLAPMLFFFFIRLLLGLVAAVFCLFAFFGIVFVLPSCWFWLLPLMFSFSVGSCLCLLLFCSRHASHFLSSVWFGCCFRCVVFSYPFLGVLFAIFVFLPMVCVLPVVFLRTRLFLVPASPCFVRCCWVARWTLFVWF